MKRGLNILIGLGVFLGIFFVTNNGNDGLVEAEYQNGQIITQLNINDTDNILSTEFRYITSFLEQYKNIDPHVEIYLLQNYVEHHTYNIEENILQGKKDNIVIQVSVTYNDGSSNIIGGKKIKNIKKRLYDDYIIIPDFKDDAVYFKTNGITAIIDNNSYDEEIILFSNPNYESPNIAVGFHKDYALYGLQYFGVISKDKVTEMNYEGFKVIDLVEESDLTNPNLMVEYGATELIWSGLYPYDLEGNEIIYESNNGELNFVNNGELSEIYKASNDKYNQMKAKLPEIRFKIIE